MLTLLGSAPGPFQDDLIKQRLATIPKPRNVTIAWRDRILMLLAFLFFCLWATLWIRGIIESWKKNTGFYVFAVAFLILFASLCLVELRRELRNHSLWIEGDFALGWITSQRTSRGKGKRSIITYGFTDTIGRTWSGKGDDSTKKYVENMPVIIFYNPYDPHQNVAACATVWKVRKPDGDLIPPV